MKQSFQTYAKQKGIDLHRDDIKFIKQCLLKIPHKLHRAVLTRYCEEWLKGYRDDVIVELQPNLGRRNANLFLLEYLDGTER